MSKESDKIIVETKQYLKKENELLLEVTQELNSRGNRITELEEKIEQLEKQIELMMNCENCNGNISLTCSRCKNYSNWHIKQGEI